MNQTELVAMNMNEKNKTTEITQKLNQRISNEKEVLISSIKIKIGLIPVVGSIINELLFETKSRIKQNRINELVDELGLKVAKLEEVNLNREYLESNEFYDITEKVFESALKISTAQKRKALANIYIEAIQGGSNLHIDQQLLFADFVTTLAPAQIYILDFVHRNTAQLVEIGTYESYYEKFTTANPQIKIEKSLFKYYNTDLEIKSLISSGEGLENFDDKSSRIVTQAHKPASISLTDLGRKLLVYLENE